MANLKELQTKVETKIKTFHLAARENRHMIKRDIYELVTTSTRNKFSSNQLVLPKVDDQCQVT